MTTDSVHFGGSSTALTKTANTLGKSVQIEKVSFNLFSKPSKFFNQYTVKMGSVMSRSIFLPKPWFRDANGIGAGTDATLKLIGIFGVED